MINHRSTRHENLIKALQEAFDDTSDSRTSWTRLVRESPDSSLDGFLAIQEYGFTAKQFPTSKSYKSLEDWLIDIDKWSRQSRGANAQVLKGDLILQDLWESYSSRLAQSLQSARQYASGVIPEEGGVLAFLEGVGKSVIIRYSFGKGAVLPDLHVVHVVDQPRAVFDFWDIIDRVGMHTRNELKAILTSTHKLVFHRGVLIHIDRRGVDIDVFGPSIDTMLLAEIICQGVIEENPHNITHALDIGCGNGLLSVIMANYLPSLTQFVAIDTNPAAIGCTSRNLAASGVLDRNPRLRKYIVAGPFDPTFFNSRFDLVVCNPPYIPLSPARVSSSRRFANFSEAVSGTTLMREVIQSTPDLLTKSGRMLVMISNISLRDAEESIPEGYELVHILQEGFEVAFDVEAVLEDTDWLTYLQEEHGLIQRNGSYYHRLHPIWIKPKHERMGES